ncbi:MAG: anion permease [Anaerolineae bacterium]|nr:anion permease [Anaerolineae bacterium]
MSNASTRGKPAPASGPEEGLFAIKLVPALISVAVGLIIWFLPPPQTLVDFVAANPDAGYNAVSAWHLFAIFVGTIVALITKPLPMGAIAMIAIALTALTGTLKIAESLDGFRNTTIWLIVAAFFVSRGFIKTGLGARIAYQFMRVLGKKTLGLSYGLIATDLVLAPAIPSNTARAGGVIFPILRSVASAYGSEPNDGTARKIGAFLTKAAYQGTIITSAMFLTAMAANPLAQKLAGDQGIEITWTNWATAAVVPGIISLLVVPYVLYRLYKPEITETPKAPEIAREKLAEMGAVKTSEWIMLGVFVLLLAMWILGSTINVDATVTALTGLGILLITGVLTWTDVLNEKGAWDTLTWFAALVMMASFLSKLGFIPWFSAEMGNLVGGMNWVVAFLILSLAYFYSHYLFASNTAHVSAMYAAFLAVSIAVGTPPLLAALVLAFFSNLFSSMTHYGTGPAPVLFGAGYVDLQDWWRLGFIISVINIVIWLGIGGLWWKILGLW